ncbi:uncharacterized protein LOC103312519 [Tribolium castaneum]|uniref:Uncharacterized protein n=1 Tax=Tribolium castaneum TaxID=7070 RepID=D2A1G7_TRICA|nr:PREDICTED: uncharacterized protein LOC103312519 [Tribolium castaneum]XP_015834704.1 PREDICTED: uncharacterized protein LOC103312519 [Tribolium castaneum]EFA02099.1 hypothetical protein TcasGA2_TC007740 [Tribolium castaneum]|eukprot:XP_008191548.1 PREDICTED: uncharacterized protein LOC103312519 [Tribolium castaneum]
MKLKKVCLLLFVVLLLLLLNEISCIANYNQDENLITDEDRRAAETGEKNDRKRGLIYDTYTKHQQPSGYHEAETIPNTGYAYPVLTHHYPSYPSGGYGLYAPSGSGHGFGYGPPAHDHGHGNNALALKGLLIPLAGIALLGAAAALSTNPVLLQLGVVNGRRRRRRSFTYPEIKTR